MSEVIKREDTAIIFKKLDECRRHMTKGNIFSCLTSFREALRKMKVTRMLPADEKELNKIINEFQEQLPLSKTFHDVYGPVTFRDNDIDTALDFMNQLILIKEEEIQQSLEMEADAEEGAGQQFATLEEKMEKIKIHINIGNYALAQELIGEDDDIISQLIDFYNSAGIAFRRNNDSEKAIQEFKKALVVYQSDEGIYYNLARAYGERKEWKSEEEAILNGLNINPEFQEGTTLLNHIRQNMPSLSGP
jgi:tetratricopeptide (TPR) repeat protein